MRKLRRWALGVVFVMAVAATAQCIVTISGPLCVGGSPATMQPFASPFGVAPDGSGGWFVSDAAGDVIQRVLANGTMSIVMGTLLRTIIPLVGEGGPGTATFLNTPYNLASDGANGVLIADRGQNIIRRLCANGTSLRIAGNTSLGSSGDGRQATFASLNSSAGVASDATSGGVWIADSGKCVNVALIPCSITLDLY